MNTHALENSYRDKCVLSLVIGFQAVLEPDLDGWVALEKVLPWQKKKEAGGIVGRDPFWKLSGTQRF